MAQSELIKIKGRLAFENIFEPYGGGDRYSCVLTEIDPTEIRKLEAEAAILAEKEWGKTITNFSQLAQYCIHDGAEKAQYDGFSEGEKYLSANNTIKPTVVDKARRPITKASGIVYAGCYVMLYGTLWTQNNNNGKGINFSLAGVQFVADGEPFGGGKVLEPDEFDQYDDLDDDMFG